MESRKEASVRIVKSGRKDSKRHFALAASTAAAAGMILPATIARAASDAYSTNAASGNFSTSFTLGTSTPTTGGTSSPASGDSLYFGAATTTTVNNDLTSYTYGGLTFLSGAAAFTLQSNAFTLTGNITNSSGSAQIINNSIAASGTDVLALMSNGSNLTLGGNLTGSGTFSQTGVSTGVTAVTLGGSNSGFDGTFTEDNASSTRLAFSAATAGSAAAAWTLNRATGGGVALNFANGTINFGALSGGAYIRDNDSGTDVLSVGSLNTNTTFSGQIQTNGADLIALNKVGTGSFDLTGSSSYTGTTTVAEGTLELGGTGSVGSTAVVLGDSSNDSGVLQLGDSAGANSPTFASLTTTGTGSGNAVVGGNVATSTLTLDNTTSVTFGGVIGGSGTNQNNIALRETGTGTLILTGPNTFTGATTISSGIINYQNATAFGANSAITIASGGTAQVQGGIASIGATNLTISGTGATGATGALENVSGTNSASMPIVLASNSTISADAGALTLSGGVTGGYNLTLASQSSGNGAITLSTSSVNNGGTITNSGPGSGLTTISAVIGTNVTGVAESSATSGLTLTNANTYSGSTAVNVGTLAFINGTANAGSAASSAITVGQANLANTAVLRLDSSAATGSQTTTRGASLTFNATSGGTNPGLAALQEVGPAVSAAKIIDQFTGPLTLNTGAYVLPALAPGSSAYSQLSFGSFVRNPGTLIDFSRGLTATLGATATANQTAGNENLTFSTPPTLVGGVLVGVIVNQNLASYSSTNGITQLTGQVALAASGQTTQNASLTSGSTLTLTASESVNSLELGGSGGSGGTTAGATLTVTSGMISVGQNSTLGNNIVEFGSAEGIISVQNTRNLTVNSVLDGSGGLTVALNDATANTAYAVLTAANTYTGITRFIGNGNTSVKLTNSLALQYTTLDYNNYGASFNFGNGVSTGQTAYTFGGLEGSQNINLNNNNTTVGAVALTIGSMGDADTSSTVNTYSGVLYNTVSGGSIIKAGASTEVFTGANTYSGGTIINAGVLAVNNTSGSGTGTGGVAVNGGTLRGTGTITGAVTLGGGTVEPGNGSGAGSLTTAAAVSGSGNFQADVNFGTAHGNGSPADTAGLLVSSGSVNTATMNFSLNLLGAAVGQTGALTPSETFVIIASSNSITDAGGTSPTNVFASLSPAPSNLTYTVAYSATGFFGAVNNQGSEPEVAVTIDSVPEPTSVGLLSIGGLGLMRRRRRGTKPAGVLKR